MRLHTRAVLLLILGGLIGLPTQSLRAQSGTDPADGSTATGGIQAPAAECCLVMLLPVGARAVALGRALTARPSPDAAFANPAGLASLDDGHLLLHHTTDATGQALAVSMLFTPAMVGTIGLSYQLLDHGDIISRDEDGFERGVLTFRDHVLIASYAAEIWGGISGGVNLKLYRFRIGCRGSCGAGVDEVEATTQALDAGVRFRPSAWPYLELGAAISNVGFALQVVNAPQADALPTRLRVGVAYELLGHFASENPFTLWLALDVREKLLDPGAPEASVGLEFAAADMLFLRAGFAQGEGVGGGASVGVGLRQRRFTVAVAKSFGTNLLDPETQPFQVSLGLLF